MLRNGFLEQKQDVYCVVLLFVDIVLPTGNMFTSMQVNIKQARKFYMGVCLFLYDSATTALASV